MVMTSAAAKGKACPVCGSPDMACMGAHGSDTVIVEVTQARPGPATVIARGKIATGRAGSVETDVRTTPAEAAKLGLTIISNLDGSPYHKKRPAPKPVTPTVPEVSVGNFDVAGATLSALKAKARELDIAGRSTMSRSRLEAAITSATNPTKEGQ